MASIRNLASCIGIDPNRISVLRNFLGFRRSRMPSDPAGVTVTVSLRRQVQRLKGKHFHLNVIAVGSNNFSDSEFERVDYMIYKMRNIYHPQSLGVGRVQHWNITVADADGLDAPTSKGQLEELTDQWEVDNNGIDLFIPHDMNVPSGSGSLLGRSPNPGPCLSDGKDKKGQDSPVSGLWGSDQLARTSAHEVGHYLDLDHRNSSPDNLMCQSSRANSIRNSVDLTNSQGSEARGHCMVWNGCSG